MKKNPRRRAVCLKWSQRKNARVPGFKTFSDSVISFLQNFNPDWILLSPIVPNNPYSLMDTSGNVLMTIILSDDLSSATIQVNDTVNQITQEIVVRDRLSEGYSSFLFYSLFSLASFINVSLRFDMDEDSGVVLSDDLSQSVWDLVRERLGYVSDEVIGFFNLKNGSRRFLSHRLRDSDYTGNTWLSLYLSEDCQISISLGEKPKSYDDMTHLHFENQNLNNAPILILYGIIMDEHFMRASIGSIARGGQLRNSKV